MVDGVNITNSGYGAVGSYSIVFGSLGSGVTTDFIKETQVKTAGFEAEYGQATGGVVNVVTQSRQQRPPRQRLRLLRPTAALESDWRQLQTVNGSVNTVGRTRTRDFGVTLGGPLVKDKLFFFGAFNPQYQTRTIVGAAEQAGGQPGRGRPEAAHACPTPASSRGRPRLEPPRRPLRVRRPVARRPGPAARGGAARRSAGRAELQRARHLRRPQPDRCATTAS